jgi:hypothetical protein
MGVCYSVSWCERSGGSAWWDNAGGFHFPYYRSSECKWRFHVIINSVILPHEGTYIVITMYSRTF